MALTGKPSQALPAIRPLRAKENPRNMWVMSEGLGVERQAATGCLRLLFVSRSSAFNNYKNLQLASISKLHIAIRGAVEMAAVADN